MDGVRPASADLAIEKARTAARLQRPTAEIEDNINQGRTAFVTADIMALRGGMPVRVNGEVVGAVGVAGLSKETDTGIATTAAAALSPAAEAVRPDCLSARLTRRLRSRACIRAGDRGHPGDQRADSVLEDGDTADAIDIEGLAYHLSPRPLGRGDALVDLVDLDISEPMRRHPLEVLAFHFE
jgi:hypothetical protein